MNAWINLQALWKIGVIGLLAGAGLPAVFAVGLRLLHPGAQSVMGPAAEPAGTMTGAGRAGPLRRAAAVLCFAVVLGAIGWAIYTIVKSG